VIEERASAGTCVVRPMTQRLPEAPEYFSACLLVAALEGGPAAKYAAVAQCRTELMGRLVGGGVGSIRDCKQNAALAGNLTDERGIALRHTDR
jgi:hypothetical protein